ncbi:hypothetical protein ACLOJK_027914 [Asimina triloba]
MRITRDTGSSPGLEREIAAAAEKLAQCQDTIFLLGKQLNAMRPSTDLPGSPKGSRHRMSEDFLENEPSPSSSNPQAMRGSRDFDQPDTENIASSMLRAGGESPLHGFNSPMSPSDTESALRSPIRSKQTRHGTTRSSSSSTSTPEKHGRGFSRFFSKGKSDSTHKRQMSSDTSN